jgi:hypothetical protein
MNKRVAIIGTAPSGLAQLRAHIPGLEEQQERRYHGI